MKPIVIVGGGMAALGAASVLQHSRHPFLIIESQEEIGGRAASRADEDWTIDVAAPYFRMGDSSLLSLIREAGLLPDTTVLQDNVMQLTQDGQIVRAPEGHGGSRVTLRGGIASLFEHFERELRVVANVAVGALLWDEREQHFLFRDKESGRAVRHPDTNRVIEASGTILAVPGTAARKIVAATRFLESILPSFKEMRYEPGALAIFQMLTRYDPGWCVLEMPHHDLFEWLTVEDRKCPCHVRTDVSVLALRIKEGYSQHLKTLSPEEAVDHVYSELGRVVTSLPEEYSEGFLLHWKAMRPAPGSYRLVAEEGVRTDPPQIPFALAGDYTRGSTLDLTAESGILAARQVLARLHR